MADILVPQETHRTTTQDETLLPIASSIDAELLFYTEPPTSLLHFLQSFTSKTQISIHDSTSNPCLYQNSILFSSINQPEIKLNITCNQIQSTIKEDTQSEISADTPSERITTKLNNDIQVNTETEVIVKDSTDKIEKVQSASTENLTSSENDKSTCSSQLGRRRPRHRLYRRTLSSSHNITPPILSTGTDISPPTSTPTTPDICSSEISPPIRIGCLKRRDSNKTTNKTVHFADSVNHELTQIKYFQSLTEEDAINHAMTNGSSVKNNISISPTLNDEYKPWSFDLSLTTKPIQKPRKFFCLYHQPVSQHPDLYLQQIKKYHIKLEHADIRSSTLSNNEQYLYGTYWVTNDNYLKNTTIKYTFDNWSNTYEYKGEHCCHIDDFRNMDQFQFNINIPDHVERIDFVLRYHVNGQEYWDNNEAKNYTLETESTCTPLTTISFPHDFDINEMRFY